MATNQRPDGWIHDWQSEEARHPVYDAYQSPDGSYSTVSDEEITDETRARRMTQSVATVPGKLLIQMATATSAVVVILGLIGVFSYHTWGWWVPTLLGLIGLGITGFFAFRRRQLLAAFRASGPRNVIGEEGRLVRLADSETDRQEQLREMAAREGEKVRRAREEYSRRTARFFPHVEALQRAMKQMVNPSYDAVWLEIDIRPTLASFIATVLVIPIGGFLIVLTAFALLLA